jgi:lipoprotein-anchoring transpeptidase ErfK/SrfK
MMRLQRDLGGRSFVSLIVLLLLLLLLPGAASAQGVIYTVQPGDTLNSIAVAHGTTAAAIVRGNSLTNPDYLKVGQRLIIPSGGATAKPPSTSPARQVKSGSYNRYGGGPQTYLDATRFAVSISKQHCWLIQDNLVTDSWPCSTGRRGYETPPGFYTIESKAPVAYGSRWNFYMPYWLGIYYLGFTENGIHGLPYNKWGKDWGNRIGTPVSFGCVVLQDAAAKRLYEVAYIGMQIIILK